jgi:indole-3-glycerol phosphate synthase
MSTILDRIKAYKLQEVAAARPPVPLRRVIEAARAAPPRAALPALCTRRPAAPDMA